MAQALRLRRWGWFCILCRGTKLTLLRLCVCLMNNDRGQHNGYYVVHKAEQACLVTFLSTGYYNIIHMKKQAVFQKN